MISRLFNRLRLCLLTLVVLICSATQVMADEMRPGLLNISENSAGWFDVTFKVPLVNNNRLPLKLNLPSNMSLLGSPSYKVTSAVSIELARYKVDADAFTGKEISIDGLALTNTDVMTRIELLNGTVYSTVLRPTEPVFSIPETPSIWDVASSYWSMGIIHILEGADHLLFVFAMLMIVSGLGTLIKAITAFTVAHSITLALASLGKISLPASPTEAIISLSIVFLAVEIIHKYQGQKSLTERYPWVVAFLFGLFHGLGFAGALAEIGLPQVEVPTALIMFNVGVETGQLLFILGVIVIYEISKRLPILLPIVNSDKSWKTLAYSIGSVAAYWTIDRVIAFLPLTA